MARVHSTTFVFADSIVRLSVTARWSRRAKITRGFNIRVVQSSDPLDTGTRVRRLTQELDGVEVRWRLLAASSARCRHTLLTAAAKEFWSYF